MPVRRDFLAVKKIRGERAEEYEEYTERRKVNDSAKK
jgi:hypothetical protein